MRKKIRFYLFIAFVFTQIPAFAQLTTAIDSGVTMGHIHLLSKAPDAQKKIWIDAFGAQPTKTGTLEMLRLPGIFIIINKAEPSAGSVGSTADHFGLLVMDHIHLTTEQGEVLRQWYVKTFGAGVGSRRNLPYAMFNGNEVDFLPARMTPAPTKGRAVDHIGFEVKNLEAFMKKLQADGVTIDAP